MSRDFSQLKQKGPDRESCLGLFYARQFYLAISDSQRVNKERQALTRLQKFIATNFVPAGDIADTNIKFLGDQIQRVTAAYPVLQASQIISARDRRRVLHIELLTYLQPISTQVVRAL